jgi:hypothetical protein
MQILKKFDFDKLSRKDKIALYGKAHELYENPKVDPRVLTEIPEGNCVWVDSACLSLDNKDFIALEDKNFEEVFIKSNSHRRVHLYKDISSKMTCTAIAKVYAPSCYVFYFSPVLKYLTLDEFKNIIGLFKWSSPEAKILVMVDMKFMLYHRLHLTNNDAVSCLSPKKQTRLGAFKYMLEF